MKKIIILSLVSILCFSGALFAQYGSSKKTVAIINFQGPQESDNVALANMFATRLANKRLFKVVSGRSIDSLILQKGYEKDALGSFGTSRYESAAIEIAKAAKAEYVVLGNINKLGNQYKLVIKILNVTNNEIVTGDDQNFSIIEDVETFIDEMCDKLSYYASQSANPYN